ncbi:sulfotransferase [Pseudomaricurvus sp. HS19]|uniref:sulfotransferase family protein n=1 Tax=Pseudomaricurvus sp. HS19 TaxID=2692626 RepID=UPI00136E0D44|nr:sulfotransferase [Pseudomaricurvus sp. HS19]MYM63391.1 hypothetical protein [Pseudomaricurvus sp. HS19]
MKNNPVPVAGSQSAEPPVFVVGASRSGSSLLAAMLNAHSRIACGPESQLLNKLKPAVLKRMFRDRNWPALAVERVSRVVLAEQRVIDLFGVSEQELFAALKDREPSVAALFDALVGTYAAKKGKPRWAEKTPRHLLHLDTLRAAYPEAKIIRIVRDFRDSAISMRQLPWASRQELVNCYICSEWFERTGDFFLQDDKSLTVKYETLVREPEKVLTEICSFIGESFESGMLDTSSSGMDVMSRNESWKQQVTGELDESRLYRWKGLFTQEQKVAFDLCAGGLLAEFGYEVESRPRKKVSLLSIDRAFLEELGGQIVRVANKGVAIEYCPNSALAGPALVDLRKGKSVSKYLRTLKVVLSRVIRGKTTFGYLGDAPGGSAVWLRLCFGVTVIKSLDDLV